MIKKLLNGEHTEGKECRMQAPDEKFQGYCSDYTSTWGQRLLWNIALDEQEIDSAAS